jgi:hypothetical protein
MGVRVHRFDMSMLSMRAVSQQQQQSIGNNNSTTYLHLSCDALGDTVVKVNLLFFLSIVILLNYRHGIVVQLVLVHQRITYVYLLVILYSHSNDS